MNKVENKDSVILGQKYAYATVSLVLGIFSFIHLAGAEKAVLAIIFGWLALRAKPLPVLKDRRLWAQAGLILGSMMLIILLVLVALNFNEILRFIEELSKINFAK